MFEHTDILAVGTVMLLVYSSNCFQPMYGCVCSTCKLKLCTKFAIDPHSRRRCGNGPCTGLFIVNEGSHIYQIEMHCVHKNLVLITVDVLIGALQCIGAVK